MLKSSIWIIFFNILQDITSEFFFKIIITRMGE
jgi:hypothetical protein